MNIKNKYCLLSELNQDQIDKLVELMPDDNYLDYSPSEVLIGFSRSGNAGTWRGYGGEQQITYKEMLSLLGEEALVPHVHQKEIIAWANGEEIELFNPHRGGCSPTWDACCLPVWNTGSSYRVKPKLTPTQLRIKELTEEIVKLKEQDIVERGVEILLGEAGASN